MAQESRAQHYMFMLVFLLKASSSPVHSHLPACTLHCCTAKWAQRLRLSQRWPQSEGATPSKQVETSCRAWRLVRWLWISAIWWSTGAQRSVSRLGASNRNSFQLNPQWVQKLGDTSLTWYWASHYHGFFHIHWTWIEPACSLTGKWSWEEGSLWSTCQIWQPCRWCWQNQVIHVLACGAMHAARGGPPLCKEGHLKGGTLPLHFSTS